MSRLIDADALKQRTIIWNGNIEAVVDKKVIDDAPTVDAVSVVHGEWIEQNSRPRSAIFYCSECHRTCYDVQPTRDKTWKKRCRYAFCPNCGAKMDGKEQTDD